MKHVPTFNLLDLAGDLIILRDVTWTHQRREAAILKLAEIDEELLSRMPEGEFVTLLDEDSKPVGFEPECYSKLDEAQAELDEVDEQAYLDDSSYYFYRD